jgi:hypothetical protein
MLNLFQIIMKWKYLWGLPLLTVILAGGYGLKTSGYLSPGPVSAIHPQNQPISGYVSHADFQQECGHCHAPIHCITDDRCQECHQNIARQRSEGFGLHNALPGTEKCQTCHTEHQGSDHSLTHLALQNISHERLSGFSLERHKVDYADNPLDCHSCHGQDSFARETLDCITCHAEADHDYLAAHIEEFGAGCVDCHDGKDRMIDFDHDPIYPLDGAHEQVECDACHLDDQYAVTPNTCAGCHAEPELHANLFGTDCARCHTTNAWVPAQLIQHTFALNHDVGTDTIEDCETCHGGTYTEYPCYTCHEKEEMEIVHLKHDIQNIEDCLSCHPTGRESVQIPTINKGKAPLGSSSNQ